MKREKWIQKLMVLVFEQAKRECKEETAYGLSKYLHQEKGLGISERNITRYYNFYIEEKQKEQLKPDRDSLDILSGYLEYGDFKDFLDKQENEMGELKRKYEAERSKIKTKLLVSLVGCGVLLITLVFFISKYYKKNCMIWVEDHYEKIRCSGLDAEKALDEVTLQKQKRITVSDTTNFFKAYKPIIWYDKSNNTIEFFTSPGIHPTNKKTLKPVSEHIINRYVLHKNTSENIAKNNETIMMEE